MFVILSVIRFSEKNGDSEERKENENYMWRFVFLALISPFNRMIKCKEPSPWAISYQMSMNSKMWLLFLQTCMHQKMNGTSNALNCFVKKHGPSNFPYGYRKGKNDDRYNKASSQELLSIASDQTFMMPSQDMDSNIVCCQERKRKKVSEWKKWWRKVW